MASISITGEIRLQLIAPSPLFKGFNHTPLLSSPSTQ